MRINDKKYRKYKKLQDSRKHLHKLKRERKKRAKLKNKKPPKKKICSLPAPSNFSLINNPEECIKYFNNALEIINKFDTYPITDTVQFEISKIESMTIDALMYQLAIMTNLRAKSRNIKILRGTMPQKPEIKKMLLESGFLSYLKTQNIIELDKSTSTTEILTGDNVDGQCISKIIDFINNYFKTTLKNTKYLYTFLTELMTNTKDHAYDNEEMSFTNKWYIYAVANDKDEKVSVTFIDTGYGLPNTVRKKRTEIIQDMIKKGKLDKDYILSALKGEFRTSTNKKHRGEGMPYIHKCVEDQKIKNLIIISSYGMIKTSNNELSINNAYSLANQLQGTLYYFEIDRECIEEMKE